MPRPELVCVLPPGVSPDNENAVTIASGLLSDHSFPETFTIHALQDGTARLFAYQLRNWKGPEEALKRVTQHGITIAEARHRLEGV